MSDKKIIGTCPICKRIMIEGPSIDSHHLIPKTYKGKETILIHKICHRKIHASITEKEMKNFYHTIERLLNHTEIQKFIKWIKNKDPEFYSGSKETKKIKLRRKRK